MYWDVVSFDLASLYPHIIQLLNISPETKVDKRSTATINGILDKTFDSSEYTGFSISPSATLYDNSISGMMPDLMKKYYSERKVYKKKQQQAEADYIHTPSQELQNKISTYKNIQMAKKIAMNSAYGVMGCRFFRYYDLDNANAITSMGQVAIRWVSNHLNDYLNTVLKTDGVDRIITNDTDSLFMNLNDLVIKRYGTERPDYTTVTNFLDLFSEKYIAPFIRDCYDDLGKYLNVKNQCLSMVRDVITINFLIKGKKRYIAQVTDCEGLRYPEPKLKFVGIEVVRSSTPRFFRDKLKESCKIIMTGDNTQLLNYISDIRNEMTTVPTNLISFGTGVSDAVKYADSNIKCGYIKGTPIGCRAAIIYNKYVVDNKLESKYPLITSGDKIKYVYLTMPNIFKENVLGYIGEIPNSSKVVKYLDYDLMLEKAFVNPLSELLDIVGWKIKEIATLESFFT
jgi:DNA polymerase elongation subunit (family B)